MNPRSRPLFRYRVYASALVITAVSILVFLAFNGPLNLTPGYTMPAVLGHGGEVLSRLAKVPDRLVDDTARDIALLEQSDLKRLSLLGNVMLVRVQYVSEENMTPGLSRAPTVSEMRADAEAWQAAGAGRFLLRADCKGQAVFLAAVAWKLGIPVEIRTRHVSFIRGRICEAHAFVVYHKPGGGELSLNDDYTASVPYYDIPIKRTPEQDSAYARLGLLVHTAKGVGFVSAPNSLRQPNWPVRRAYLLNAAVLLSAFTFIALSILRYFWAWAHGEDSVRWANPKEASPVSRETPSQWAIDEAKRLRPDLATGLSDDHVELLRIARNIQDAPKGETLG